MSKHGVFVQEEATALTAPITGSCSIPVVVGTAPVNMVQNPEEAVNTPILANSAAEAMAALGYSDDFKNYTLCQVITRSSFTSSLHREMRSKSKTESQVFSSERNKNRRTVGTPKVMPCLVNEPEDRSGLFSGPVFF